MGFLMAVFFDLVGILLILFGILPTDHEGARLYVTVAIGRSCDAVCYHGQLAIHFAKKLHDKDFDVRFALGEYGHVREAPEYLVVCFFVHHLVHVIYYFTTACALGRLLFKAQFRGLPTRALLDATWKITGMGTTCISIWNMVAITVLGVQRIDWEAYGAPGYFVCLAILMATLSVPSIFGLVPGARVKLHTFIGSRVMLRSTGTELASSAIAALLGSHDPKTA